MIEYKSVQLKAAPFEEEMQELLNDGWFVTWQGACAAGGTYSPVYFLATLRREVPSVTKTVEP